MIDLDAMKRNKNMLIQELKLANAVFKKGDTCFCPFHDNQKTEAGSVSEQGGHWVYRCHNDTCGARGDFLTIRSIRTNRSCEDLLREMNSNARAGGLPPLGPKPLPPPGKYPSLPKSMPSLPVIEKAKQVFPNVDAALNGYRRHNTLSDLYEYNRPETDSIDLVVAKIVENGKKRFLQIHPVEGGWSYGKPDGLMPIYNRSEVLKAKHVVVVEGEKCVKAISEYLAEDWAATTSPMGAGKAELADWSPLSGKNVVLWPDNDEPGTSHMDAVSEQIQRLSEPPSGIAVVNPQDLCLEEKQDVADWLKVREGAGRGVIEMSLMSELENAMPVRQLDTLWNFIDGCRSGENLPIDINLGWRDLTNQSYATIPKAICVICGEGGSGKSYALLECAMYWHLKKIKVAVYMLEEDRDIWMHRCLVLLSGKGKMSDRMWIHNNADAAESIMEKHQSQLLSFNSSLHCRDPKSKKGPTQKDLLDWAEEKAKSGCRIIVIDPATAAIVEGNQWTEDQNFVITMLSIARTYKCTIILSTHPKQANGKSGQGGLAGGASYSRFAQCILWFSKYPKAKEQTVHMPMGPAKRMVNREFMILKARHAPGGMKRIGFYFDPETLRMAEQGILEDEEK